MAAHLLLVLLSLLSNPKQWSLRPSIASARAASEEAIMGGLEREDLGKPCKPVIQLSRLTPAHLQHTADGCINVSTLVYKLGPADTKDKLGRIIDRFLAPRPW
jgi:hypothetical protein